MAIIEFPAKKDWEAELERHESSIYLWCDDGLDPRDMPGRFAFFGALVGVFCCILSAISVVVLLVLAL